MKSIKKIISILFAVCIILSSFGVIALAADAPKAETSMGDQLFKIEFESSLDEKQGKEFVSNSLIKIYQVPENATLSSAFINEQYIIGKAITDNNGKATVELAPGTYIVTENNFRHNGKEYRADPIKFTVKQGTVLLDNKLQFKHYLVNNNITPAPIVNNNPTPSNPKTGVDTRAVYIAMGSIVACMAVIIFVSIKTKRLEKADAKN